jgi:hypothetical protein
MAKRMQLLEQKALTDSKMDAFSPMLPEGVRPSPPMRPAHMSERMSPYKLGITITTFEYWLGSWQICRTKAIDVIF